VAPDVTNATGSVIGGDLESPVAGTITAVGAYVDTAGTGGTSLMTIDINKAGTTILTTKITIDATEKSSRNAATQPVINGATGSIGIAAGNIITADVDGLNTTPAKGLTIRLTVQT